MSGNVDWGAPTGPQDGPLGERARSIAPASRASRRRWVVALVALMVVAGVAGAAGRDEYGGPFVGFFALLSGWFLLSEGLRAGTRCAGDPKGVELDERDAAIRGRAHVVGMRLLVGVIAVSVVGLYALLPHVDRATVEYGIRDTEGGAFVTFTAAVYFAIWLAFWTRILPTIVLAWQEPDPVAPEPGAATAPRVVPEGARDALFGAAIVVSVAFLYVFPEVGAAPLLLSLGLPWVAAEISFQLDRRKAFQTGRVAS